MTWAAQSKEWEDIKDEMVLKWEQAGRPSGGAPTAYEITMEQKRRMNARGETPMGYEDILDEIRESGSYRIPT